MSLFHFILYCHAYSTMLGLLKCKSILSGEAALHFCFCSLITRGQLSKNPFMSRPHFWKSFVVQKIKQEVTQVVHLPNNSRRHGGVPKLNIPYKFYVLEQTGLSKQCRPRSDCFFRSSLIRVYAVCHSISIFWMH